MCVCMCASVYGREGGVGWGKAVCVCGGGVYGDGKCLHFSMDITIYVLLSLHSRSISCPWSTTLIWLVVV